MLFCLVVGHLARVIIFSPAGNRNQLSLYYAGRNHVANYNFTLSLVIFWGHTNYWAIHFLLAFSNSLSQ